MATRTASAAQATAIAKALRVGLVAVNSTFSIPASQSISIGDVIQMIRVPQNSRAVFVGLTSTYVQATVEVGDGLLTNRYIGTQSTSALHASSTFMPSGVANVPYTYSLDDTIDIQVSLVSVSTIAGAFYLTAILSMDPTQG
jgi:hypothetical protein